MRQNAAAMYRTAVHGGHSMSIKSILAPFTGSETDRPVGAAALRIAAMFEAQIGVIFARGHGSGSDFARFGLAELGAAAYEQFELAAREQGERMEIAAREHFSHLLDEIRADPSSKVTAILDLFDGNDTDAIIEWGGVYDLLVVANPAGGAVGTTRNIAETSLANTGRPVVLVPDSAAENIGQRIVIGWNRSSQASRAIAAAMPFLERAADVLVVHVDTGAKRGPSAGRLRRYLELHGIDAKLREIEPDYHVVGEQVLDEAAAFNADLLVLGAYSRSRMRERIFGGVTQYVFDNAGLPVLMAR
jgi:nucleotide-binding universal stress UspA family protein